MLKHRSWRDSIAHLLRPERPGDRTLILCRTAPQVASWRRAVADSGGQLGLEITTPLALAMAMATPAMLAAASAAPPEAGPSTLLDRVGERAGLRRLVEARARALRLAVAAGRSMPSSTRLGELATLAEGGWAQDDAELALTTALRAEPTAAFRYDRVFSVGFTELGGLSPARPAERALLTRLGASPLDGAMTTPTDSRRALPFQRVAGVTAEARLVVHLAREAVQRGQDVVILVPDVPTLDRVHAAAERNQLDLGREPESVVGRHTAARLLRRLCEWVSAGPSGLIAAEQLADVYGDAHFRPSRSAIEAARERLEGGLPVATSDGVSTASGDFLPQRAIRSVLGHSFGGRRTAAGWADLLRHTAGGLSGEQRTSALVLSGWVHVLSAATARGTVGGLLDVAGGLAAGRSKAMTAALSALERRAEQPAALAAIDDVLAGTLPTGDVYDGLDCLLVEDWDGRHADLLLVLGAHDKGLAARPAPDPLLSDDELRAFGELTSTDARAFRLSAVKAAAARATQTLVVASRVDSTGRAVCIPPDLALDASAGADLVRSFGLAPDAVCVDSLGLGLHALPERRRATLRLVAEADETGQSGQSPLALQANLEWVRCGRSPVHRPGLRGSSDRVRTLADLAPTWGAALPESMKPYLGAIGPVPTLLASPWSVSSHFEALTNCLYRFFAETVLKMRPEKELDEDESASEVGALVHASLESAFADSALWADPEGAAVRLAAAVEGALISTFDARHAARAPSVAQRMAAEGMRGRWLVHLKTVWAPSRVAARLGGDMDPLLRSRCESLPAWKEVSRASKALTTSKAKDVTALKAKVNAALTGDAGVPSLAEIVSIKQLAGKEVAAQVLIAAIHSAKAPEVERRVNANRDSIVLEWAPQVRHWAELEFGPRASESALEAVALPLGALRVPIRGSIDRLDCRTVSGVPALVIIDYKTGKPLSRTQCDIELTSLARPQLPVYALALDAALQSPEGCAQLGAARVAGVGYDFLKGEKGSIELAMTPDDLARTRQALEVLVRAAAQGDFWLMPLTDDPVDGRKSWGFPTGRLDLRRVSRFEESTAAPSDDDEARESEDEPWA